jgi:phosphate transport system permease protein
MAVVWIIFERLFPFTGALGFWILWFITFTVFYAIALAVTESKRVVLDRVMAMLFTSAGFIAISLLVLVIGYTALRGWTAVVHVNFFKDTMAFTGPDAGLDQGGVYAAIVGTLQQIAIAMTLTVPLGFATALYLVEVGGKLANVVRAIVDAMSAIPTIVAGLFIFATLILTFGFERSGLAAAVALSVEMLPVVTRTAAVVLRLVPNGLREASYALGSSQWATTRKVVLPTARAGLVTAILLGVARVIGETAPVLLVAGVTSELNYNPSSGPQVSLPLYVFLNVRLPFDTAIARAFGAALVLLLIVIVLFGAARFFAGRGPGHVSRRQRRRMRRLYRDLDERTPVAAYVPAYATSADPDDPEVIHP